MMISPKCILWGGYGYGNVGDELTLAAAIRDMKSRFGYSIAILSPAPGYTKALFPGEHVVHYQALVGSDPSLPIRSIPERAWLKARRSLGYPGPELPRRSTHERLVASTTCQWVDLLREAELLYLVGGGYLTDLFSPDQFLTPVEVANHFSVAVATAPLGIGPFTNESGLLRFGHAFREAKVRVRDDDSLTLCMKVGIEAVRCADDGFRVKEVLDFSDISPRKVVGVNYFDQHGVSASELSRQWWRDMVVALTREGIEVEGFCFHNQISSDFSKTVELLDEAGIEPSRTCAPDLDFRVACRRIASYRGIVTCRFHAAVVANVLGVPTLATASGPYYRSKMAVAVAGSPVATVVDPALMNVEDAVALILGWFSN